MDDYYTEEEIKIEYNESFETDPLCEKSVEYTDQNCDAMVDHFNISSNEINEIPPVPDDCTSMFDCNSSNYDIEQDNIDDFTSAEQNFSWYREIDDSGKYVCKFCDLTYSTIQTTRHHVKTKHPNEANALKNIIQNNRRNPKIKCHICKERFKIIRDIKEHMKEHYSALSKSCQVCFASFDNDQEMLHHLYQEHQSIPNVKMYSCNVCGYRTRKLSHFKQHKNTHKFNKDLKCNFCEYSTNYSPNLKIHERIHTNNKPYVCSYKDCNYSCSAKSALRSHLLKHNPDENMLLCDKCTYKTVYRHSLKKHIDSHERNSLKLHSHS